MAAPTIARMAHTYRIIAMFQPDGEPVQDASQAEVLGEAFEHDYATRADAERYASFLRAAVDGGLVGGLHPSTRYFVRGDQ
jgi:hypothetical protein